VAAFCSTSSLGASPRFATTACVVPRVTISSPRLASSCSPRRTIRHRQSGPRSIRRPASLRRSRPDYAARPAGSACSTSSSSCCPASAHREEPAADPADSLAAATSPRRRPPRSLPRARPAPPSAFRPGPSGRAPPRHPRSWSHFATPHSPLGTSETPLTLQARAAVEGGSSSTPLFAAAARGKKP